MSTEKEARKEYNKIYYATKKEEISKKLYAKEECQYCKRVVGHQQMPKHIKSKFCQSRSNKTDVEMLKNKIDKINKLISDPNESNIRKSLLQIINDVHEDKLKKMINNDISNVNEKYEGFTEKE